MRLLTFKAPLAIAFLGAFALMPASVRAWTPTTPLCNTGTAFSPTWVACSGAWAGNFTESPSDLAAMLTLIQTPASWRDSAGDIYDATTIAGTSWWSTVTGWQSPDDYVGKTDDSEVNLVEDDFFGNTSGTLTFLNGNRYGGVFVLILKGGTNFSMFVFDLAEPVSQITYNMSGVGGAAGAPAALSHVAMWGGTTVVPEPSSLLLLGSGLLGLGLVGYRRRRN